MASWFVCRPAHHVTFDVAALDSSQVDVQLYFDITGQVLAFFISIYIFLFYLFLFLLYFVLIYYLLFSFSFFFLVLVLVLVLFLFLFLFCFCFCLLLWSCCFNFIFVYLVLFLIFLFTLFISCLLFKLILFYFSILFILYWIFKTYLCHSILICSFVVPKHIWKRWKFIFEILILRSWFPSRMCWSRGTELRFWVSVRSKFSKLHFLNAIACVCLCVCLLLKVPQFHLQSLHLASGLHHSDPYLQLTVADHAISCTWWLCAQIIWRGVLPTLWLTQPRRLLCLKTATKRGIRF